MARQQSSVKGKGTEVLLGSPQAVPSQSEPVTAEQESQPVAELDADAAVVPAASTAEGTLPGEGEVGSALYEEARAAESTPVSADASWLEKASWPPSAEAELALIEHDQVIQATSQAATTEQESAMTDTASIDAASKAATEQEVAAIAAAATEAAPDDDWDMQEPEEKVETVELPETPLPADQEAELTEASSDRMANLNAEIDDVYDQVLNQVGDNESIAIECYNALLKARDIVLRDDVGRLAQAEYYVKLARARLKRAAASAAGARKNAWWIFAWGLIWGMLYAAGILLLDSAYVQDAIARLNLTNSVIDPKVLLPSMVWGGIGGVLAIWYSLFKHISARDFDGNYNISYLGKPFFGLVLGATVYMVVSLLVTSLGIWPSGATSSETGAAIPMVTPWIIYFVAMVAGFKENRVFGLIDQIMRWIFPEKGSTTTTDGGLP
jgi:hypothetical protein